MWEQSSVVAQDDDGALLMCQKQVAFRAASHNAIPYAIQRLANGLSSIVNRSMPEKREVFQPQDNVSMCQQF